MSRGFDRVTDVWQLKIVQLFGAVRIPRRSFRTVLRPFFVFSSIFILPFPSLFFSILHRVAACQLLVTRDPGIEPIVSKLAKSPWKNRALSNPTLSLLVSNLFESKFFLFLFSFCFNSIFSFIMKVLLIIYFTWNSRGTEEINFKWFIKNLTHVIDMKFHIHHLRIIFFLIRIFCNLREITDILLRRIYPRGCNKIRLFLELLSSE